MGKWLSKVALVCVLATTAPAFASSSEPGTYEQKSISYGREQRFSRPADPVVLYRSAENVVLQNVNYQDLPAYIRSDIEKKLSSCKSQGSTPTGIKAVSYVSDHARARNLSPNYLVDFSEVTQDGKQTCLERLSCNDSGCLAIAYHALGYEEWKRDVAMRNLGWSVKKIEDARANTLPNPEKNMEIAVFDFSMRCANAQDPSADACHVYRVWTAGGMQKYEMVN